MTRFDAMVILSRVYNKTLLRSLCSLSPYAALAPVGLKTVPNNNKKILFTLYPTPPTQKDFN